MADLIELIKGAQGSINNADEKAEGIKNLAKVRAQELVDHLNTTWIPHLVTKSESTFTFNKKKVQEELEWAKNVVDDYAKEGKVKAHEYIEGRFSNASFGKLPDGYNNKSIHEFCESLKSIPGISADKIQALQEKLDTSFQSQSRNLVERKKTPEELVANAKENLQSATAKIEDIFKDLKAKPEATDAITKLQNQKTVQLETLFNEKHQEEVERIRKSAERQLQVNSLNYYGVYAGKDVGWKLLVDMSKDQEKRPDAKCYMTGDGPETLKDGLYQSREDKDEKNSTKKILLKDGSVTPLPPPKIGSKEYEKSYGEAMRLLASTGATSVTVNFSKPEDVSVQELRTNLQLAKKNGLTIEPGAAVFQAIEQASKSTKSKDVELVKNLQAVIEEMKQTNKETLAQRSQTVSVTPSTNNDTQSSLTPEISAQSPTASGLPGSLTVDSAFVRLDESDEISKIASLGAESNLSEATREEIGLADVKIEVNKDSPSVVKNEENAENLGSEPDPVNESEESTLKMKR